MRETKIYNQHENMQSNILMSVDHITEDELIQQRRISIVGVIDQSTQLYINSYLRYFNKSSDPVYLYISSVGGDVVCGYSIIDQIMISNFPVYTIVCGEAYSMGAMIAAYGENGHRYIKRNSNMMMHPVDIQLPLQDIHSLGEQHSFFKKDYEEKIYQLSKKIGFKYEDLLLEIRDSKFLTAEESIFMGLVDKIWSAQDERNICEKFINDCKANEEKKNN